MRPNLFAALSLVLSSACFAPASFAAPVKAEPLQQQVGVYKVAIEPGVSMDDAAESMRLRANALNLKLVAELPLSKQVEANTGKPQRTTTVFEFCDAVTAKDLIDQSLNFAIYVPCRIALVEDAKGQGWLIMIDINVEEFARANNLSPDLKARIQKVRDGLDEIIQAGSKGEL
ncbi:MAG: hypothetical protein A2580_05875 [Hydrogenophilales bacterium RIFOXYD1_FULL_62_11]|nr:MAG: hypothetical protein A2580_05875 [Hydrogenophilales bacterium RIFOXYD1_FULL_62_11]